MAIQYSVAVRNNMLEAFECAANGQTLAAGVITGAAAAPKFRIYSGAMPANCADAATGTLLLEFALPADWMANAAAGAKARSGTWSGTGAAAALNGTAGGYFRIVINAGTTCHMQGTLTATGGGGDATIDNISIASGQTVQINTFSITAGNA